MVITFSAVVNTQAVQTITFSPIIRSVSTSEVVKNLKVILNGQAGYMPLLMGVSNPLNYVKWGKGMERIWYDKFPMEK
jgi:hypothetical protein